MKRPLLNITLATAMCAALLTFTPSLWAQKGKPGGGGAAYTIVPFNPPGLGSTGSYVGDLNDGGQAVGQAYLADGSAQTVHLDLATGVYTLLQSGREAEGINNLNQIVGRVGLTAAFWSSPSAQPVPLPPLPGDTQSIALAINDDGIVAGGSRGDGLAHGVVWRVVVSENGPVVDGPLPLPPLAGDPESWASDINQGVAGTAQVAGLSATSVSTSQKMAVVWTVSLNGDGTLAVPSAAAGLGTLGLQSASWSDGKAINFLGDVCGASDNLPVIARAGELVQPLPLPRNTTVGRAADVNDFGEIVGTLMIKPKNLSGSSEYAYLWKNGTPIDLNTQIGGNTGWARLWTANVINSTGVIAGYGSYDVPARGFLLIPK